MVNPNMLLHTLSLQFHEGGPRMGLEYLQFLIAQSQQSQQYQQFHQSHHRQQQQQQQMEELGSANASRSGGNNGGLGYGQGISDSCRGNLGTSYGTAGNATTTTANGSSHGGLGNGGGNGSVIDRVNLLNGDSCHSNNNNVAAIPAPLPSARGWLVTYPPTHPTPTPIRTKSYSFPCHNCRTQNQFTLISP